MKYLDSSCSPYCATTEVGAQARSINLSSCSLPFVFVNYENQIVRGLRGLFFATFSSMYIKHILLIHHNATLHWSNVVRVYIAICSTRPTKRSKRKQREITASPTFLFLFCPPMHPPQLRESIPHF